MMPTYSRNSSSATPQVAPSRGVQQVVVVNSRPEILMLAQRALAAGHYDVVFVETIGHAYSQIRRIQPNLVILCLRMDDREAFQLLSMLALDPETKRIPVLTYTAEDVSAREDEEEKRTADDGFLATLAPARMN